MIKLRTNSSHCFAIKLRHIGLFLLLTQIISASLLACTSFCFQAGEQVLVGKSYDWMLGNGYLMINKRDMAKTALLSVTKDEPARWVSKYGSVTFNQYGREFPIGGMNEKGLVIETLVNFNTVYPKADKRPAVNVLGWVQYCLDTCSNVQDVIDAQKKIRIAPQFPVPLHFMIADSSNKAMTVEFIYGQTVCTQMNTVPTKILTNSHYSSCLNRLGKHKGFGGEAKIPVNWQAHLDDRFVIIADRFKNFKQGKKPNDRSNIDFGIKTLQIARATNTKWNIIYDLTNRKIYFKQIGRNPGKWKHIEFDKFSYAGNTPVKILDIMKPSSGDVTKDFINYKTELNRKLVFHTMKKTPSTMFAPDDLIEQLACYPENIRYQPLKKVTAGK